MRTRLLLQNSFIVMTMLACVTCPSQSQSTPHRENGWYYIVDENQDSLSGNPIVTVKEFGCLHLNTDTFGTYAITGTVSKHRQKKWANATERYTGKHIAFVFNDSVISAPRVNGRIECGKFQISVPRWSNIDLPAIYQQLRKEKIDSIDALFHGWDIDSTYTPQRQDSLKMEIDYWEAKAWVELMDKPNEHYWYSIEDSAKYKSFEKALYEELQKGGVSSRASDYMKSGAYKGYKQYIAANPEYINLMFQGFLLHTPKGLNGYLVDDIIQSIYPEAPSIRDFVNKTDNEDDEKWAIYEWQRKIWALMNSGTKKMNYTVIRNGATLKGLQITLFDKQRKTTQEISYTYPSDIESANTLDVRIDLQDVNFDGRDDILVNLGQYGNQMIQYYDCLVWDDIKKQYRRDESFKQIENPQINNEKRCVFSSSRISAASYSYKRFEFIDGHFVETAALTQTFRASQQPPLFTEKQYVKNKGLVTLHKDVSINKINRDWLSIIMK